jgi:cell division protein FtsB
VRLVTVSIVVVLVLLQHPLWFGKGGWLKVRELDTQLNAQRAENERLKTRNAALGAEVRDLKTGFEAIEERARSELGMIRQDETFVQMPDQATDRDVPAKP